MQKNFFARQREKTHLWKKVFFGLIILFVLANVFIRPVHPHFSQEKLPGFWAIFGLGGAVVLAVLSKTAAHKLIGRDEDFYDRN